MIYFDNNKTPFGFEIDNYIASVDDNIWDEYAGTTFWDIVDGVFVPDSISLNSNKFYGNFISLSIGNYRKKPKGYSSAVESFNTMDSFVSKIGKLPANTIIVYPTPDFSNSGQCTEEWLEQNKIQVEELTKEQFDSLYVEFITKWNSEEH